MFTRLAFLVSFGLLAACNHGLPTANYQRGVDDWVRVCESHRFALDMPAMPIEGRKSLPGAGGQPVEVATWTLTHGNRAYVAWFAEFAGLSKSPADVVAEMSAAYRGQSNAPPNLPNPRERVVEEHRQSGDGWATSDLVVEMAAGPDAQPPGTKSYFLQMRIVLSRSELYLLVTVAPSLEEEAGSAARFLQSLHYRDAASCEQP